MKTEQSNQQNIKVCVVGLGYIGLPTAAVMANHGFSVVGVDVREDVVDTVNRGQIHIHEPFLSEVVGSVVASGHLRATTEVQTADVFIICVPTPINDDKSPDLSYVAAAAKAIRPFVRNGNTIILESTSPPKTTEEVVVAAAIPTGMQIGRDVFVAYCPERVIPGKILKEVVENDRIVGGITPECAQRAAEVYRSFVAGSVYCTTAINAEFSKLAENSYRDVNIAFANELSVMAESSDADPFEIIKLANCHPRVNILSPGPGVGGHCISVDPWFLVHAAPEQTPLISTARQVNDQKPLHIVSQIEELVTRHNVSSVGCLGLAYKADVDDLRESPSLEIVRSLQRSLDANVFACEPHIHQDAIPDISLLSVSDIVEKSDLIALLTDHSQFNQIAQADLEGKIIVDPRGVWKRSDHRPDSLLADPKTKRAA